MAAIEEKGAKFYPFANKTKEVGIENYYCDFYM